MTFSPNFLIGITLAGMSAAAGAAKDEPGESAAEAPKASE